MNKATDIRAFLEVISIDDVRAHLDACLAQDFNEAEKRYRENRPLQSVAGCLALKRALCRAAVDCFGLYRIHERDFTIETPKNDAPRLARIDTEDTAVARAMQDAAFVSISHSRTTAAGLAVIRDRRRS
jgi:phosphopantetheinyl transferase (holo-ACP synthase)